MGQIWLAYSQRRDEQDDRKGLRRLDDLPRPSRLRCSSCETKLRLLLHQKPDLEAFVTGVLDELLKHP